MICALLGVKRSREEAEIKHRPVRKSKANQMWGLSQPFFLNQPRYFGGHEPCQEFDCRWNMGLRELYSAFPTTAETEQRSRDMNSVNSVPKGIPSWRASTKLEGDMTSWLLVLQPSPAGPSWGISSSRWLCWARIAPQDGCSLLIFRCNHLKLLVYYAPILYVRKIMKSSSLLFRFPSFNLLLH